MDKGGEFHTQYLSFNYEDDEDSLWNSRNELGENV